MTDNIIDMDKLLREKFSNGQGVLQLQEGMPDAALLSVIKFAISLSDGKPFVVVPSDNDVSAFGYRGLSH